MILTCFESPCWQTITFDGVKSPCTSFLKGEILDSRDDLQKRKDILVHQVFLPKDRMLPVVQVVHGRGEAGGHPQALLPPDLVERLQVRLLEQLGKAVAGDELGDHPKVQPWLVGHHPVVPEDKT